MEKGQDIQPIPATELADTEVPNSDQEYVTRKRGVQPSNCTVNSREGFNENGAGPTDSNVIYGVPVADDTRSETVLNDNIQTESSKVSKDSQMYEPPKVRKHEISDGRSEVAIETPHQIAPPSWLRRSTVVACIAPADKEPPTPKRMKKCESNSENERSITNKKALPKTSRTYELEKFEKHALLIFNQENFDGNTPRLGTAKDVEELKRTFSNFGFEITEKHDLTKDEIMKTLEEFSSQDFTDYGCVAVAVLTHGSSNGRIQAKDDFYSELEIINNFKVDRRPTLLTKPKIFFIQACRGYEDMAGTPVNNATKAKTQKDFDEEVQHTVALTLPVESDMLIVHSSFKGKQSHRNPEKGTWFIQSLCKKINELADTQDLQSILREAKREVAIKFSDGDNKQMPVSTSTLTRKLYLKRFNDQSSSVPTVIPSATAKDQTVLDNASSPEIPCLSSSALATAS